MAKKRKKKARRNRRKQKMVPAFREYDVHHLCFRRTSWKMPWARKLREMTYCKVVVPRLTIHNAIHRYVKGVPVPKEVNARQAVQQLEELQQYGAIANTDSIERRLTVLIALFECVEEPTVEAFRKQLEVVNKFEKPLV